MNLLYPTFNWRSLPRMLGIAVLGAIVAGIYGVIHDQITYTISPEYFTRLKFDQFAAANFGYPTRIFVGEIGFLATWWVGFIAGWFMARIALPVWPARIAFHRCVVGFAIILISAIACALIAYPIGAFYANQPGEFWNEMCEQLRVEDISAFTRVGIIHYASYLGGLLGLIIALIYLFRSKRRDRLTKF